MAGENGPAVLTCFARGADGRTSQAAVLLRFPAAMTLRFPKRPPSLLLNLLVFCSHSASLAPGFVCYSEKEEELSVQSSPPNDKPDALSALQTVRPVVFAFVPILSYLCRNFTLETVAFCSCIVNAPLSAGSFVKGNKYASKWVNKPNSTISASVGRVRILFILFCHLIWRQGL